MKKRSTKHYSPEEWVDFAMQLTAQTQKAEMQQHLDVGCKKCAQLRTLWTRIGEIAAREHSLMPPDSAVQHIRSAFASLVMVPREKRAPLLPRLTFDSLWQPAIAGIRSSAFGMRKLVYKARDISVEMHIEAESRSERVNLTGQISFGSLQGQAVPSLPVMVSGPQGKISSTATNSFGEFHLSYVPDGELLLLFELESGDTVAIPLGDSMERALHQK